MSVLRIDREDPIAILTLERPDKLNALSRELIDELLAAVEGLEAAPETRAVIVTGAGDRAFAAGADIAAMAEMSPAEAKAFSDRGHRLAASATDDPFALVRQSALEALSSFDPRTAGTIARRMAASDPEPRVREVARSLER